MFLVLRKYNLWKRPAFDRQNLQLSQQLWYQIETAVLICIFGWDSELLIFSEEDFISCHSFNQFQPKIMSRRKQAKPIRHLEDGTPALNGKKTFLNIFFYKMVS